jgi:serine/threonine-protein kinase RsbW
MARQKSAERADSRLPAMPNPSQPRSSSSADAARVHVFNERTSIEAVHEALIGAIDRNGYSKASKFAVRLALEEAIANAFHHGHRGLPAGMPVTVDFQVTPEEIRIAVEDQGPGFNPGSVPDPTLDENLEQPSGRGLMLIRAYMTEVGHNTRGNRL